MVTGPAPQPRRPQEARIQPRRPQEARTRRLIYKPYQFSSVELFKYISAESCRFSAIRGNLGRHLGRIWGVLAASSPVLGRLGAILGPSSGALAQFAQFATEIWHNLLKLPRRWHNLLNFQGTLQATWLTGLTTGLQPC